MKKFIGTIASFVASVLTFVFLAIPAFVIDLGLLGKTNYSGYQLLTDKDLGSADYTSLIAYRVITWILIVVAVLVAVYAVVQLLSSLKVIKVSKNFTKIGTLLLIALAIVSILALASNIGYRVEVLNDLSIGGTITDELKERFTVGAGLWLVAIVNTIIALANCVVGKLFKK